MKFMAYDYTSKTFRTLWSEEHAKNLIAKAKRDGFRAFVICEREDGLRKAIECVGYENAAEKIAHWNRVEAGRHGARMAKMQKEAK